MLYNADMALVCASSYLRDDEFLKAFSACELPLTSFRHADHLRLAWLILRSNSPENAVVKTGNLIRRFAAYHGVEHIYHETITGAWVRLIASHEEPNFEKFLTVNSARLNSELLHRFWTQDLLYSEAARQEWREPDLHPLPCPASRY